MYVPGTSSTSAQPTMLPPPVHILGLGNLGKLIAHSLRTRYPDLPITLLFHRPASIDAWREAGASIEIVRNGTSNRQNGFTTELVSSSGADIHNLVVATKTYTTVDALRPLKHRLQSSSALLFLQNGIG
jgi:2-dehydropantoate 2-reductase